MPNPLAQKNKAAGYPIIKGIHPLSLLDWPGKLAGIIFLGGCNFKCGFCHNPELVLGWNKLPTISQEELYDFLEERKKWLDGVVITGGEPTIFPKLPEFIKKIKKFGLKVSLQTNGTNPEMLARLLKLNLLDHVAMDIKGAPLRYEEITCTKVNIANIKKSVDLLIGSKVDYEFRTTVLPLFHEADDMEEIGKFISGAKAYYLQQFRPEITLNKKISGEVAYLATDLEKLAKIAGKYVEKCGVRGI